MNELIGKTIVKVELGSAYNGETGETDTLIFTDDKGKEYIYSAAGDCCSTSWFAHITGIKKLLKQTVTDVIEHEERGATKEEYKEGNYESLVVYGYTLQTKKGSCDIEFRNDSNGYYGGECVFYGKRDKNGIYKEITKDF